MSRFRGWTAEAVTKLQLKTEGISSVQKKNKFNARKKEYNGILYDSKFEAEYAQQLDLRVMAKDIKGWERQVVFELSVNGKRVCKYIIDFVITYNDGTKEYIETKGYETTTWRIKRKLFQQIYPTLNYRVVRKNAA